MKIKAVRFYLCELQKYWGQMYDFSAEDAAVTVLCKQPLAAGVM